jgi:flagellar hook-associated protein 1 FlgK
MAVGFSSYGIARSGLAVNEYGLFVTGQNISNVDTTGYVRQQAIIENSPYIDQYSKNRIFQYGLGADIQETRQIRDSFLDNIYRRENTALGYWETRAKAYEDVEAILNDPMGDGLQDEMNQFWDSWQELSKDPESLTVRALVRQRAQALVYHFNHIGTQLDKLQDDLNSEIQVRIDEVNSITHNIAQLNKIIMGQEINGDSANDYRDQRNLLLDRLSKLCNAQANEMQDGQIDVTLGGYFLVCDGSSKNLYVEANAKNGTYYYPMLEGTNIEVNIKSGILKGLLQSRGEVTGIKGSYSNGTPKEKVDITFAIDTTQGTGTGADEYLSELRASISAYVEDLKKSGSDFSIRFVTMNGTSSVYGGDDNVYTADTIDTFLSDTAGLDSLFSESTDTDGSFDGLITTLESLQSSNGFRTDATKVAYVFTNKSIDGNNGGSVTDAAGYINRLNDIGMRTSIITSDDYTNQGEVASEVGWSTIATGTGGKVFDISQDTGELVVSINSDTRYAVNATMGNIPTSTNIVSDVKIKLNAMLNAMAKEINYLEKSGYTLNGETGVDFFQAIDDDYPMQMGNIKLSDEILSDKGLNYISAGTSTAKGDNTIALKIANLRDLDIMQDISGDVSIDEYYRSVILDIGNGGSEASTVSKNQETLVQSAEAQRDAISGVSLDEEMANMIKFKYGYDGAARVLNIIDTMIETVITSMGIVGR